MALSSLISAWCQCLEVFVVVPPADVSPMIRWGDGSCVQLQRRGSGPSLEGVAIHSPSFLTILFFLAGKHQRRLFDPTCVSLQDPLPEKSVARLHSHTPCPPCLDWFSVHILEGITAICRLLRNKGGSSLSSLQYFRGITWPDKHALALLYTCSLFCPDLSTHPNCPLYLKADYVFLSHPHSPPWIGSTLHSSVFCKLLTTERKLWVIALQKPSHCKSSVWLFPGLKMRISE